MNLSRMRTEWNRRARRNALYYVLTDTRYLKNQEDIESFFADGRDEIDLVVGLINKMGLNLNLGGRALDFGCGVGRLAQALADYFQSVYGIDISDEMIRCANLFNRHGKRVKYLLNVQDNLRIFGGNYFDFIISDIVLQHVPAEFQSKYISEFVRVLSPSGILMFQIPGEVVKRGLAPFVLKTGVFAQYGLEKEKVHRIVKAAGGRIICMMKSELNNAEISDIIGNKNEEYPNPLDLRRIVFNLLSDKRASYLYVVGK
jgi:ubiquinone/menaquinone biosynthesis C-methylase UbiE